MRMYINISHQSTIQLQSHLNAPSQLFDVWPFFGLRFPYVYRPIFTFLMILRKTSQLFFASLPVIGSM